MELDTGGNLIDMTATASVFNFCLQLLSNKEFLRIHGRNGVCLTFLWGWESISVSRKAHHPLQFPPRIRRHPTL